MEIALTAKTPKYLSRPAKLSIRPAPGWVDLLAKELVFVTSMPFARYKFLPDVNVDDGAVRASNVDFRQAIEWCARLTTAHDVEWLAWEGKCRNWGQLAKAAEGLRETGFLPDKMTTPAVKAQVTVQANSSFVVSSAKIRQAFVTSLGVELDAESSLRIRLDLYRDHLSVFVSLAGDPLYKRGYKQNLRGAVAPLPEHQAAACIRAIVGFDSEPAPSHGADLAFRRVFVPFAGTGTFAFEWVLASAGLGPGSFPRAFAFMGFAGMPPATLQHLRKKLDPQGAKMENIPASSLICLERHPETATELKANISRFCELTGISEEVLHVRQGDFFKSDAEAALRDVVSEGGCVTILLNPPYGQRMKIPGEARLYFARIAERILDLETRLGISIGGCCIVPDDGASAAFARKFTKTHIVKTVHFTHGGDDTRLVIFHSRN